MCEIIVLSKAELDEVIRRAVRIAVSDLRDEIKQTLAPEIMTESELADYLRCDMQKITRLMKKGLPFVTVGEVPVFIKKTLTDGSNQIENKQIKI